MKTRNGDLGLLEQLFKDEEFDVSYFSVEFPDGSSYEYEA